MLQEGAWLRHARHSNAMAKRLESAIRYLSGVEIVHPVQTNAVFAKLPDEAIRAMHQCGWHFYTHVGTEGEARLMCSWDTTPEDVDAFAADLQQALAK
jgi:threonine aldolase